MEQEKVEEIWAPCKFIANDGTIETYPGYEVSNLGRVKSLNYNHTGKPRVLKPGTVVQSNGTYFQVQLCKDKKSYWRSAHRLVLSSFNPKGYFKGAVVDHIDSNPSDNRLSNLRWVTYQVNSSTFHCKEALSKANINHPALSKRVRVTFLDDNHYEIFVSSHEVERTLKLPKRWVVHCIRVHNGLYKKLNLLFEYI